MTTSLLAMVDQYLHPHVGSVVNGEAKYRCPFHKGGRERHPSFYMNMQSGIGYCHTCHEWMFTHQLLARLGAPAFVVESAKTNNGWVPTVRSTHYPYDQIIDYMDTCDALPMALVEAGFSADVLSQYEVGYDAAFNRIVFVLRDVGGTVVNLIGRNLDPGRIRYMPYHRTLGIEEHVPNRNHVWGLNYLIPIWDEVNWLVVCEGYKAALWAIQAGYHAVGLMGSSITKSQADNLTSFNRPILLLLDNDTAGGHGNLQILRQLRYHSQVVYPIIDYPDDLQQPDDLSVQQLRDLIEQHKEDAMKRDLRQSSHRRSAANAKSREAKKQGFLSTKRANPGADDDPIPFYILPAEYGVDKEDWFYQYDRIYHQATKFGCSIFAFAENGDLINENDPAYQLIEGGYFGEGTSRPKVSARALVNIVDASYKHVSPGGEPTKCDRGKRCLACNRKTPFTPPIHKFIDMSPTTKLDLFALMDEAIGRCAGCGKGYLVPLKAVCTECGHVIYDQEKDLSDTPQDFVDLYMEEHVCPNPECGHTGQADVEYVCDHKNAKTGAITDGCTDPKPGSILDIPLLLTPITDNTITMLRITFQDEAEPFLPPSVRWEKFDQWTNFLSEYEHNGPLNFATDSRHGQTADGALKAILAKFPDAGALLGIKNDDAATGGDAPAPRSQRNARRVQGRG